MQEINFIDRRWRSGLKFKLFEKEISALQMTSNSAIFGDLRKVKIFEKKILFQRTRLDANFGREKRIKQKEICFESHVNVVIS